MHTSTVEIAFTATVLLPVLSRVTASTLSRTRHVVLLLLLPLAPPPFSVQLSFCSSSWMQCCEIKL